MSDLGVFVLCAAVCAGAWWAAAVSVPLAAGVVTAGLLLRRPAVLIAGAGLLASGLGASAWAGLTPPPSATVDAVAVLVADPVTVRGAVKVDLRLDGHRVEAWSRGAAAAALRPRLSGESVRIRGRLRAPPPSARRWLVPRHVAARLEVESIDGWRPGSLATRAANGLRRTLERGAGSLDVEQRSLLLGVVLGDDREQPAELEEAFRGAGLSHLLAVSGQNVAFVLALAGPVLRRLGLRGRWAATLGLIAFFGLLTRWEPSVLRAAAMAALACTAGTLGRPASRLRLLALAVTLVVLIDPLLVHSVGFQLSAGATAGIALFARPLNRRLPEPLAVTIAAQAGVAPVLIPVFGGVPLASLPANLLAVPVAAPLTAWGLTGGLLAGVAGPPFDGWLHLPTGLLTAWLASVARWSNGLPMGEVRTEHALALAGAVVLVVAGRWLRARAVGSGRWSSPSARTGSTSPAERS